MCIYPFLIPLAWQGFRSIVQGTCLSKMPYVWTFHESAEKSPETQDTAIGMYDVKMLLPKLQINVGIEE